MKNFITILLYLTILAFISICILAFACCLFTVLVLFNWPIWLAGIFSGLFILMMSMYIANEFS